MRRMIGTACLLALLLTGCLSPQTAEVFYLEDVLPSEPPAVFTIGFGLPADAVQQKTDDGYRKSYQAGDGSYAIETAVCPGVDAGTLMQELCGAGPEALHPIKTTRYGMEEYRFSWCREADDGLYVCTAAILEDDGCCYSLVFSAPEAQAKACRGVRRQVMESFALFEDEGF